jgi:hypothetical protein
VIEIRKDQAPAPLAWVEFGRRFRALFADPAFRGEDGVACRTKAVPELRAGRLQAVQPALARPRPK